MSTLPDSAGQIGRVVVLDSRPLWRAGLCRLLSRELGTAVVGVEVVADLNSDETGTLVVSGQRIDLPPGFVHVWVDDSSDIADLALAVLSARCVSSRTVEVAQSLTTRERSVLRAVGRGLLATEIGDELGISARTVERHRQVASAKLGARSPAQAVALAFAQRNR